MPVGESHGAASGVPGKLSALMQQLAAAPTCDEALPTLQPGQNIGRFQVVREIGRGGAGVVYEARDRELGRAIALKTIRGVVSPEAHQERLFREAEAAARLIHPNIATLLDVGRSEQGPYLVLEFLRGRTLAHALASGALASREALRIAHEVAQGLAHAHAHGVVHRDLTPGNVFLCDDGQVKILDFGMACAFGHRKIEGGTAGYMAPEQCRGAPEDERTDVFALGVLLFRMLTGDLPFAPADLETPRPAPPVEVDGVPSAGPLVAALLEKDPVKRPRDGAEILDRLRTCLEEADRGSPSRPLLRSRPARLRRDSIPNPARAGPPPNAIAVLPFVNISGDPEQEYFSDGLSEEILSALAHVRSLLVTGRTSSFSFKGTTEDVRSIGAKLGVGVVLEGSVRRVGGRVRVTAHLVRVADGFHVWSHRYDRDVTDLFTVQDDIAQAVVKALKIKLLQRKRHGARCRFTDDAEVYNEYLLGRYFFSRGNVEGFRLSVEAYERVLARDSTYAPAHAGLAVALQWLTDAAARSLPEKLDGQRRAIGAAETAVALAPDLADGYAARGDVRTHEVWDWVGAQADFERALSLKPGDASIQLGYADLTATLGRVPDAIAIARHAAQLDPLASDAFTYLGSYHSAIGQLGVARAMLRKALEIAPQHDIAGEELGLNHLLDGDPAAALSVFDKEKHPVRRLAGIAMAHHDLGRDREMQQAIDDLLPWAYSGAYQLAEACAWCGRVDAAFEWLERSYTDRDPGLRRIKYDPRLRNLRREPRLTAMLRKLGLPVNPGAERAGN